MERYLLRLFEGGTPPDEIMKSAMRRVDGTTRLNPLTSKCNILILNLDHLARTTMLLNEVCYQRNFELEMWPWVLRYGIWVFKDGDVDHTACDGGWVNWSMCGRFERSGDGNGIVRFIALD